MTGKHEHRSRGGKKMQTAVRKANEFEITPMEAEHPHPASMDNDWKGERMRLTKTIISRIWWLGRGTATVMGLAMLLALTVGLASTALAGTGIGARFDLGKINKVNAMSTLVGNVDGPLLTLKNTNDPFIRTFRNVPLSLETRADAGGQRPAPMQVDSDTLVQQLNADLLDGRGAAKFANGTGGKADDANLLDGGDSSAFATGTNGKADDADKLDGKDSAQFLAANGKASDADRLDGKDGSAFVSDIYLMQSSKQGNGGGSGEVRQAFCDLGDKVLGGGGGSTANPIQDYKDVVIKSQAQIEVPTTDESWFVQVRDNGAPSIITAQAICADFTPEH
jgi:hypothetical protein